MQELPELESYENPEISAFITRLTTHTLFSKGHFRLTNRAKACMSTGLRSSNVLLLHEDLARSVCEFFKGVVVAQVVQVYGPGSEPVWSGEHLVQSVIGKVIVCFGGNPSHDADVSITYDDAGHVRQKSLKLTPTDPDLVKFLTLLPSVDFRVCPSNVPDRAILVADVVVRSAKSGDHYTPQLSKSCPNILNTGLTETYRLSPETFHATLAMPFMQQLFTLVRREAEIGDVRYMGIILTHKYTERNILDHNVKLSDMVILNILRHVFPCVLCPIVVEQTFQQWNSSPRQRFRTRILMYHPHFRQFQKYRTKSKTGLLVDLFDLYNCGTSGVSPPPSDSGRAVIVMKPGLPWSHQTFKPSTFLETSPDISYLTALIIQTH